MNGDNLGMSETLGFVGLKKKKKRKITFSKPLKLKLRKCVHVLILTQVPYVDLEHQGTYWCRVYNDRDSQNSKKVEVIVGKQYRSVF